MPCAERRHRKKALKPAIKRELVNYLTTQFTMSISVQPPQSASGSPVHHVVYSVDNETPSCSAITSYMPGYPRYGFKKLFQVLRRQGHAWNHKRVHRIYCLLKLNFRRKGKQCLPVRNPAPLATPKALNQSLVN